MDFAARDPVDSVRQVRAVLPRGQRSRGGGFVGVAFLFGGITQLALATAED